MANEGSFLMVWEFTSYLEQSHVRLEFGSFTHQVDQLPNILQPNGMNFKQPFIINIPYLLPNLPH
jgi:hypothetical protein